MPANVRVYEITKMFLLAARVDGTVVGGQMECPEMGM